MPMHLSTPDVDSINMPKITPGTKVGGVMGIGGTEIPDFNTGDMKKDLATINAFLDTKVGQQLMEYCKAQLRAEGRDVSKFDRGDMVTILQTEQPNQERIGRAKVDTTWDFVEQAAKAAVQNAAAAPAAPAAQQQAVGFNERDPRHYGSGAAGINRVEQGLKNAGL